MIVHIEGQRMEAHRFIAENKSLREITTTLKTAEGWLMLAAVAAFMASAFFVVKYFVGGDINPSTWTGEQWGNACLGLGITAAITAAQAYLYASGYKGPWAALGVTIVIAFALFSEVSQSMEREDATVRNRSENSAVFQQATKAIGTIAQNAANPVISPYAGQIAQQAQIVARCEQRVKAGKEKHCKGDKARLAALESQSAAAMAAASTGASSAISVALANAKALEYDEGKHYAMIRLLKHVFGISGIWASFLFSIIIIGTFEYAFHFVGAYVADHKRALKLLGRDDKGNLVTESLDPVRPDTQDARSQDAKPASDSGYQDAKKKEPEPVKQYDRIPLTEIVRLASVSVLCDIADGKLDSFSVRAVNDCLKRNGYGKTNAEREQEIYPALVDHFDKEGYIRVSDGWIEPEPGEAHKNGKRQKWAINRDVCKEKAAGIPRG